MSKYNNKNFGADVYFGNGCGVPQEEGLAGEGEKGEDQGHPGCAKTTPDDTVVVPG